MKPPLRREAVARMASAVRLASAALLAGAVLLASAAAFAQDESAEESERTTITFRALDGMETVGAKGQERTVLRGEVEIVVKGTTIRADRCELFGEDHDIVLCQGAVQVIEEDGNIEIGSEHLLFDNERSVLRIQGSALLIDRDNEVVVKGGFMEYDQDTGEATVQIGVRILKPDLVSRSEFARYRRDENTVDLSGLPVVTYQGDEYKALRIFIDLDEESVRMEGEIRGTITPS